MAGCCLARGDTTCCDEPNMSRTQHLTLSASFGTPRTPPRMAATDSLPLSWAVQHVVQRPVRTARWCACAPKVVAQVPACTPMNAVETVRWDRPRTAGCRSHSRAVAAGPAGAGRPDRQRRRARRAGAAAPGDPVGPARRHHHAHRGLQHRAHADAAGAPRSTRAYLGGRQGAARGAMPRKPKA